MSKNCNTSSGSNAQTSVPQVRLKCLTAALISSVAWDISSTDTNYMEPRTTTTGLGAKTAGGQKSREDTALSKGAIKLDETNQCRKQHSEATTASDEQFVFEQQGNLDGLPNIAEGERMVWSRPCHAPSGRSHKTHISVVVSSKIVMAIFASHRLS